MGIEEAPVIVPYLHPDFSSLFPRGFQSRRAMSEAARCSLAPLVFSSVVVVADLDSDSKSIVAKGWGASLRSLSS